MTDLVRWVGFDLDGTLARYDGWVDEYHIGEPIMPMVKLAQQYITQSPYEVRIFTARVGEQGRGGLPVEEVRRLIEDWSERHIGHRLKVTNIKDFGMVHFYDDRAFRVEFNTGRILQHVYMHRLMRLKDDGHCHRHNIYHCVGCRTETPT